MSQVHVRLRIGAESYALPVENVMQVGELPDLSAVPGSGSAVLGVMNLRGQVLPAFDLAGALGVPRQGRPSRLVVASDGERTAGLAVDEVVDVAPLEGELQDAEPDFLAGSTLMDGDLIGLLDVSQVFAALARRAVA
jgi:chemotaxis signal transduction protein